MSYVSEMLYMFSYRYTNINLKVISHAPIIDAYAYITHETKLFILCFVYLFNKFLITTYKVNDEKYLISSSSQSRKQIHKQISLSKTVYIVSSC